jgi:hypothetical protein
MSVRTDTKGPGAGLTYSIQLRLCYYVIGDFFGFVWKVLQRGFLDVKVEVIDDHGSTRCNTDLSVSHLKSQLVVASVDD